MDQKDYKKYLIQKDNDPTQVIGFVLIKDGEEISERYPFLWPIKNGQDALDHFEWRDMFKEFDRTPTFLQWLFKNLKRLTNSIKVW